jgi:GalNAc-alpha-(1->4)-GalNAc-alpha-(1->3)-diNAcBac-PP-undecaprenol alpha-1,4-N-acetyl-D-galactosaminyltransferase
MNTQSVILVISSLTAGGAEKVMAQLANQASIIYEVNLVILSKKERFYSFDSRVKVIEPNFTIDQMPRVFFKWRNFWWLRKTLKGLKTQPVLSFSGKYNAFVLLASIGLGKKVFISDRSRPGISYGKFLDFINVDVLNGPHVLAGNRLRLEKGIVIKAVPESTRFLTNKRDKVLEWIGDRLF